MSFPPQEIIAGVLIVLGIRTIFWWIQRWQLQEYRVDRLKAWLHTGDGVKSIFNLWFYPGILPRPKFSIRVGLMVLIFLVWTLVLWWIVPDWDFLWVTVLWERTIWLGVWVSVLISRIPVQWVQKCLFAQSKMIITDSPIMRVGITGSFGKSSTKAILVHLLSMKYGIDSVLSSLKNENTEVSLARRVVHNKEFFKVGGVTLTNNKFFVAEMGAYRRGELEQVCQFLQPQIGIVTGINAQHVELFGSSEKLLAAKGELPKACTEKVFYPAEDPELKHWFNINSMQATVIPISSLPVKVTHIDHQKTEFTYGGQDFTLPWCGAFFVRNALLALETAKTLGVSFEESAIYLSVLPPLKQALHTHHHASGALIFEDLYSANPDGVFSAIEQLAMVTGRKIFVGIPLRELGDRAYAVHQRIFKRLDEIDAEVFWLKSDFSDLGKEICGDRFWGSNQNVLKKLLNTLEKNDGILLESRLPKEIVALVKSQTVEPKSEE